MAMPPIIVAISQRTELHAKRGKNLGYAEETNISGRGELRGKAIEPDAADGVIQKTRVGKEHFIYNVIFGEGEGCLRSGELESVKIASVVVESHPLCTTLAD